MFVWWTSDVKGFNTEDTLGAQGEHGVSCFVLVMVLCLVTRDWVGRRGVSRGRILAQNSAQGLDRLRGKQLPDAPDESKKKEQSGNPVVSVPTRLRTRLRRD